MPFGQLRVATRAGVSPQKKCHSRVLSFFVECRADEFTRTAKHPISDAHSKHITAIRRPPMSQLYSIGAGKGATLSQFPSSGRCLGRERSPIRRLAENPTLS